MFSLCQAVLCFQAMTLVGATGVDVHLPSAPTADKRNSVFVDTTADSAWARLKRITNRRRCFGINGDTHSAASVACLERIAIEYRSEGLRFFDQFPHDPRRWEWLGWAVYWQPRYYANVDTAAALEADEQEWRAPIDTIMRRVEETEWTRRLPAFRAALMRAPDATAEQRANFMHWEAWESWRSLRNAIKRGEPHSSVRHVVDQWLAYATLPEAKAYREDRLISLASDPVLRRADPQAIDKFLQMIPSLGDTALTRKIGVYRRLRDSMFVLRGPNLFGRDTVDIGQYRGHILVLDFWNTGCTACIAAWPRLKALAAKYRSQGVVFLGVDVVFPRRDGKDPQSLAQRLVQRTGLPWANIMLPEAIADNRYGVDGGPIYAVIGPTQQVLEFNLPRGDIEETLQAAIR